MKTSIPVDDERSGMRNFQKFRKFKFERDGRSQMHFPRLNEPGKIEYRSFAGTIISRAIPDSECR